MKTIRSLFICVIFIAACDGRSVSQEKIETVESRPKISVALETGTEYKWYRDSSCTNREREVCVTYEDYKALCLSASGATKMASSVLSNFNRRANYLLDNGDVDEISVGWKDGYTYGCRMTMEVSGVFQGSSARERLEGGVSTFIFNNEGKVLAHFASEANY